MLGTHRRLTAKPTAELTECFTVTEAIDEAKAKEHVQHLVSALNSLPSDFNYTLKPIFAGFQRLDGSKNKGEAIQAADRIAAGGKAASRFFRNYPRQSVREVCASFDDVSAKARIVMDAILAEKAEEAPTVEAKNKAVADLEEAHGAALGKLLSVVSKLNAA